MLLKVGLGFKETNTNLYIHCISNTGD